MARDAVVKVAETRRMQSFGLTAIECIGGLTKKRPERDADLRREVLRELAGYAVDCLRFRRPRDSFGGRRRSIAFGALDFLVETGVISDLEGLSRLESWDDRNKRTDGAAC